MKKIILLLLVVLISTSFVFAAKVKRGGDENLTPYLNESDSRVICKDIVNQIRAFNPSPVAFTIFENNPFKIYEAEESSLKGQVGKILKAEKELVIGCKDGSVSLKVVQKAGGKPMNIADFLRGAKLNANGDFC